MKLLIFSTYSMKYILHSPQKSKFSFYFSVKGKKTELFSWLFFVNFAWPSAFSGYNNGLLSHFIG